MRTLTFPADLGLLAVVVLLCLGLWAMLAASVSLRQQAPSERGTAPALDVPSAPPAATTAPLLQLPAGPAQPSAAPSRLPAGAPGQPLGGSGATQTGSGTTPTGPVNADPKPPKFDEPIDPPIKNVKPIFIGEDK